MALQFDPGIPLPAFPEGSKQGLVLFTHACATPACATLHLQAAEVRDEGGVISMTAGAEQMSFELDVETGRFMGADARAPAWLASDGGAWLSSWIKDNATLLRERFERLKGRALQGPPDTRPAPHWQPAERIVHHQLFPHDFTPMVEHGGKLWMIVDACCADPACPCEDVALTFFATGSPDVAVEGRLGDREPRKANAVGKALWKAVHAAPELVERLRERREDIRYASPFIAGVAYEAARVARRAGAPTVEVAAAPTEGGYLQGGATPEALVRRLFDTSVRLHAVRVHLEVAWESAFRVEVRGAFERQAWAFVEDDPFSIELYAAIGDETPWLTFALASREDASLEMRRQRCALGLPLLGGTLLPIVDRLQPDETFLPPDADDVRLAVAVAEALLAAPLDEVRAVAVAGAPRVFEHRVELDIGALDVRLTASHAEAPWDGERVAGGGDGEGLEEGDDLEDGEDVDDLDDDEELLDDDSDDDSFAPTAEPIVEAFTDAALDRGVAPDVVRAARTLLFGLGGYAFEEGAALFDTRTWTRFLEDHAPRKVMLDENDIALAPAALRAVADWLGEVGHVDARRLRASIDRALPAFQQRARDPRRFGIAKAMFTKMRAAGVDVGDQGAIDRFLAAEDAVQQLPSSPIRTTEAAPNPATVTRSPNRWSPGPGERWPAPTEPCGCGSGRRFKKCCMAR